MPYVRQKTWLPLAPRIQGLSVRESQWGFPKGMGQTCDPTVQDCSLGPTYGAISTPSLNSLLTPGISTPSDILTPNISTLNASTLPTSLSSWLQQNQTIILIGGGLLFGVALLKGLGKR